MAVVATGAPARAEQGPIHAARTPQPPKLDGRVDDPVWQLARPYVDFVEQYPAEGRPVSPAFRTEVRVLYDDRTLFVSVVCHDPEPDEISAPLARRDAPVNGDVVEVVIDPARAGRNALSFAVNAAGVLRDELLFGDVNSAENWDGVWDAAAARTKEGWSVELAIPLDLFQLSRAPRQEWGFFVRRLVYRTHQVFDSKLIPRSAYGYVSRLGVLTGLDGISPRRALQLTPYATTRLALRPQYSDPAYPQPRLVYPSADIGLDLRASLSSSLTLVAAVNPDFGQVEQDQVVLNLSNQEVFFPEKRPFFNQGLDLFQPVGAEFNPSQRLFYSRRIGLDTPILAAAKATGAIGRGLELGLLDAVVAGVGDPGKHDVAYLDGPDANDPWVHQVEGTPDRRVEPYALRPFHVGLNDELPREPPVPRNYLAGVLRQTFWGNSSVGGMVTSVNPLAPRCTEADIAGQQAAASAFQQSLPGYAAHSATPLALEDCHAFGGTTAGLDVTLRSQNGEWAAVAALNGSHRIGGPANDVLYDGTVMHPGDLGVGGYLVAGKLGGEGFRGFFSYRGTSPHLDLTAMGFQESQNQQAFGGDVRYYRSRDIGNLRELQAHLNVTSFWTTDGHWTPRGNYAYAETYATLPGYQTIGTSVSFANSRFDVREVRQYGVPLERQNALYVAVFGSTDPNRPLSLVGQIQVVRTLRQEVIVPETGWSTQLTAVYRPWAWWETQLIGQYDRSPQGGRYVGCWTGPCSEAGDEQPERNTYVFGRQDAEDLSLTVRQTWVLTPVLTFQIYAQLFSAGARYPEYFSATASTGDRVHVAQLVPLAGVPAGVDDPSFHDAAFNLNVVLRWEYRLGSVLYVVYSRNQGVLGLQRVIDPQSGDILHQQSPTSGLTPLRLGPGPAVDTVQVKWSYLFDL